MKSLYPAMIILLLACCGTSTGYRTSADPATQIVAARQSCLSPIDYDRDLTWAREKLSIENKSFSQLADNSYPTAQELDKLARYLDIKVKCDRRALQSVAFAARTSMEKKALAATNQTYAKAEDAFLTLLTGRLNYGEYYRVAQRIASQQATAMSEITSSEVQRQQATRADIWQNTLLNVRRSIRDTCISVQGNC